MDRSYRKVSLQLGLAAEWRVTERFSLAGGVLSSVKIEGTPYILSTELTARYRFVQARDVNVIGFVGAAYGQIDIDDEHKQEIANDIDLNFGPMLKVGLQLEL